MPSTLAIKSNTGVLAIAIREDSGLVSLINTIDSPLIPQLVEFLYAANWGHLQLLVDGSPAGIQDFLPLLNEARKLVSVLPAQ